MKYYLFLMLLIFSLLGCDGSSSSDNENGRLTCEVEGFENRLSTTTHELNNKKGDDLVMMVQAEIANGSTEDLTTEQLVDFYTNEDNFVEIKHAIAYSRIIKCRTDEEIVEFYLQQNNQ